MPAATGSLNNVDAFQGCYTPRLLLIASANAQGPLHAVYTETLQQK